MKNIDWNPSQGLDVSWLDEEWQWDGMKGILQPILNGQVSGALPANTADPRMRALCAYVTELNASGETKRPSLLTGRCAGMAADAIETAVIKALESATGTAPRKVSPGATTYGDFLPGVGVPIVPSIDGEDVTEPIEGDDAWDLKGLINLAYLAPAMLKSMRTSRDLRRAESEIFYLSNVKPGVEDYQIAANAVQLRKLYVRLEPNQVSTGDNITNAVAQNDALAFSDAVFAQATKQAAAKGVAAALQAPRPSKKATAPDNHSRGRGKANTTRPAGASASAKAGAPAPANRS